MNAIVALASVLSTSCMTPQNGPPDRNGDGHPLFGVLAQRLGNEPAKDGRGGELDATGVDFGDLDGDGDLDVVAAMGLRQGRLGVLFNDGDGLLSRATIYDTPPEATSPVLADFDGDGDLDCAVAIASDDSVWIFINDGRGGFAVGEPLAAGDQPRCLVALDLNGDTLPDLAVMNTSSSDMAIFLNRGDAIFDLSAMIPVPHMTPRGDPNLNFPVPGPFFAAGDIDGDGDVDLAIPATRSVRLLVNDGEGGFTLAPDDLGSLPPLVYALEFGDLDGDGDADLVGTPYLRASLTFVWINVDGVFAEPVTYESNFAGENSLYLTTSIALGDIDEDGDLDVALAGQFFRAHVIHRNNGDGTLAPFELHRIEAGPWLVDIEDMNGDRAPDFVGTLGNFSVASLMVTKLNNGEGGFFTSEGLESVRTRAITYGSMDIGDLDGDGDIDLALAENSSNTPNQIRIMGNNGDGLFKELFAFSVGPMGVPIVRDVVVGDLNGDAIPDLALSILEDRRDTGIPSTILVALGIGHGTFAQPVRYPMTDSHPWDLAIGDINGDSFPDILAGVVEVWRGQGIPVERRLLVMRNDGSGGFGEASEITVAVTSDPIALISVGIADFDGDGDNDAILSTGGFRDPGGAYVLFNDGDGNFSLKQTIDLTMNPYALAVADLDGDGDPDAAIAHWVETFGGPYLTILTNDGIGNLAISETHSDPNIVLANTILISDVNDDGAPDIFVAPDAAGTVVHLNDTNGSFANRAWYHTHSAMADMALIDIDGDDDMDLIGASFEGGLDPLFVLRQVGSSCLADLSGDGEINPEDFVLYIELFTNNDPRADIDHDGDADTDDFFAYLDRYAEGCEK